MKRTWCMATAAAIGLAGTLSATDYTYTGGGTAGVWNDANNWGGVSYPSTGNDGAIFPNGIGATITSGMPTTLYKLVTGDQPVTLYTGLNFAYGPTAASVSIGTGGLTVNSTTTGIAFGNDGEAGNGLSSAGPVTMGRLQMSIASPVQTGSSYWDIAKVELPGTTAAGYIRGWDIRDAANTTITASRSNGGSYEWTGSPVFSAGRPNWDVMHGASYGNASRGKWDLKNFTLYGNRLQIDGSPDSFDGPADYLVGNGGVVDVNSVRIALGSTINPGRTRFSHMSLANSTVLVGGTGTVWENNSTNYTSFSLTDNTTVTFNPNGASAGSASVDTGSTDLGVGGFANNFAFGNVVVVTGDTVTLTGNDNTASPANNALYVNGNLSLGDGATLAMNSRNAYLNGQLAVGDSPGLATVSGPGTFAMTSNAEFVVEIQGLAPGSEYDRLVVANGGNIALDGTLTLEVTGTAAASVGDLLFLISNESGLTSGTFQYAQGAYVDTFYGRKWAISYTADLATNAFLGGNDVALMAIPEPTSLALLALAGLAALRRR